MFFSLPFLSISEKTRTKSRALRSGLPIEHWVQKSTVSLHIWVEYGWRIGTQILRAILRNVSHLSLSLFHSLLFLSLSLSLSPSPPSLSLTLPPSLSPSLPLTLTHYRSDDFSYGNGFAINRVKWKGSCDSCITYLFKNWNLIQFNGNCYLKKVFRFFVFNFLLCWIFFPACCNYCKTRLF